ncbi:hypothetical protein ABTG83_19750, partial [Acinetobacter baumannii]
MISARRLVALYGVVPGHGRVDTTIADGRAPGADRAGSPPNPLQGVEVAGFEAYRQLLCDLINRRAEA